jgi:nucleotide-binding universal stress UspA family protein
MKILIPIDFTPVTENALKYAIEFTKSGSYEITLFHVVDSDKETAKAIVKLNDMAAKYADETSAKINAMVQTGNIFDCIGEAAKEIEAYLIIMATHGIKGMQHIIGSRAMRVITHSQTPYIVIQNKPWRNINNILVPVDFTKEGKQVLPFLGQLASQFKSALHLFSQRSDDDFLQNRIDNNIAYFESYFEENNIAFKILSDRFEKLKYNIIINEANKIDADLIVTSIDPETNITDYMMGVDEQKIVANESQIPVLCINTKSVSSISGNVFESLG